MPIIFPPNLNLDDVAPSERIVIRSLNGSIDAHLWRVYHSVYLRNPGSPSRTPETDFVICIPDCRAVICLEAKNGKYVAIDARKRWKNIDNGHILNTPPPEKARNEMFRLKTELQKEKVARPDNESFIFFGCAAAIPDGRFPSDEVSRQALLLNPEDCTVPFGLTSKIREYVREGRHRQPKNDQDKEAADLEFNEIVDYMERKAEMKPPIITSSYLRTVRGLLEPTPEQRFSLELAEENPRCIIDGAAGTGKTVLAKELAQRLSQKSGMTIGFICSNSVFVDNDLRGWVKTLDVVCGGKIAVGTPSTLPLYAFENNKNALLRHERRLAEAPEIASTLKLGIFYEGWKSFIAETLKDLPEGGIFDYLIVDEAQNLCMEPFFRLFDGLLKGGLSDGRWTIFGDFVNQNVVSPDLNRGGSGRNALEARLGNIRYTYRTLNTNCRNTEDVASETSKLVGVETPTMPGIRGPAVEFNYFVSRKQMSDSLDRQISTWRHNGVRPSQITVLTSEQSGDFDTTRTYGGWKLVNIQESQRNDAETLKYSDIYDFQGLESDVVILVLPLTKGQEILGNRVTWPRENHMRRMFYIGMSRARVVLVVVAHRGYRHTIEERRRHAGKEFGI